MNARTVAYSDFIQRVESGAVSSATIDGETIQFTTGQGTFETVRPSEVDVTPTLLENDVRIEARPQEQSGFMAGLMMWLPVLVLIGIWIFFMNRMQGGGKGGAMGFGKSKAKLLTEKQGRVTFDEVAGIDEAKEELEEIVEFLRTPQKFSRLGGQIPKGALLVGPPGTGKTLLARAIAGEAGFRSSPSRVPTSWKCSSASAQAACATCSSRPRRTRPASSSSTRSTPWAGRGASAMAAATTNANRR